MTKPIVLAAALAFLVALFAGLCGDEIKNTGPEGNNKGDDRTATEAEKTSVETFTASLRKENERHRGALVELRERLTTVVEKVLEAKKTAGPASANAGTEQPAQLGLPEKSIVRDLAERLVDEGIIHRVNLAHVLKVHRDTIVEAVAENLMEGKVPGEFLMEGMGNAEAYGGKRRLELDSMFTDDMSIFDGYPGRLRRRGSSLLGGETIFEGDSEHEGME